MTATDARPMARSVTPIRVVYWTLADGRKVTAVHAPQTEDDPAPWMAYEGDRFIRRVSTAHIPPSATTMFAGTGPLAEIEDGRYYQVIVDNRPGVGVRNSPLSQATADRPWVVSIYNTLRDRITLDALPDGNVEIIRPMPR